MAVLHAGTNVVLLLAIGDLFFPSSFDQTISGEPSSQLVLQTDASLPDPTTISLPAFAGSIATQQIDQAPGIGYTPSVLASWSGIPPINVQNALDRIAAKIGPIL
jgi:hypothetical protein